MMYWINYWKSKMTRVIDDICNNDLFYIDDIEIIEAIRFEGAKSSNDFFKLLANSKTNKGEELQD